MTFLCLISVFLCSAEVAEASGQKPGFLVLKGIRAFYFLLSEIVFLPDKADGRNDRPASVLMHFQAVSRFFSWKSRKGRKWKKEPGWYIINLQQKKTAERHGQE